MDLPTRPPTSAVLGDSGGEPPSKKKSARSQKRKSAKAVLEPTESNLGLSSKERRKMSKTSRTNSKHRSRKLLVPKLSSSGSSAGASSNDAEEASKPLSDDDEDDDDDDGGNYRRLPAGGYGKNDDDILTEDEADASFVDGLRNTGEEEEDPTLKNAIQWATEHPLTEAMHIEEALQVMLDDIRGRMGQDVEYESLPLREYFRRGFACSHRATQTDASDIIDPEGLMKCARQLRTDLTDLRRELELQIALIRTDMEHRMKEMFALMFREATKQDKIGEQKRRRELERMRKGMRQQLKNAVEGVKKWYIDYYEELLKKERASRVNNTVGRERFDDLQRLVAARDEELLRLRNKIDEHRREIEQLQAGQAASAAVGTGAAGRASPPKMGYNTSARSAASWERVAKAKQQQAAELNDALTELEKFKIQNQQLLTEFEAAKQNLTSKTEELRVLQDQLDNAGANAEEQQARAAARAQAQLRKEKERQMAAMDEVQRQAREEQLRLARQAQQERSAANSVVQAANVRYSDWLANYVLDIDGRQVPLREATDELRRRFQIEQQLRDEIALLSREAQRQNKIWANKFAILQSSQAALRNEMYLRRLIERKMEPYLEQDNWVCAPREQQVRMVDSFAATIAAAAEGGQVHKQKLSATRDAEPFLALGPVPPAVRLSLPQRRNLQQRSKSAVGKKSHSSAEAANTLSIATVQYEPIRAGGDNALSITTEAVVQQQQPPLLELTDVETPMLVDCAVLTDDVVIMSNTDDDESVDESTSATREEDVDLDENDI